MNMLDPVTNEIIYASNGCDEIHETEYMASEDIIDDNNLESNIRRRKGKIISCAKETIEQGKIFTHSIYSHETDSLDIVETQIVQIDCDSFKRYCVTQHKRS